VSISKQIITTFNPTTSATIAFGTSGQSAGLMAAFNVFTGQATTAVYDTSFTGAGELVTGANATPTGQNGGFDIYATYTVGAAGSQGTQGRRSLSSSTSRPTMATASPCRWVLPPHPADALDPASSHTKRDRSLSRL